MPEQTEGPAVEVTAQKDGQIGLGVGESQAEQAAPASTVARERFIEIIANNRKVIADAEKMLALINNDPSLDDSMCRLFGIRRTAIQDVANAK